MIEGRTVLAVIPARGGSKGVIRKNIRVAGGKPLIAWTIEEARKSNLVDRVIVSTEDSEIASVAKEWQCEVPFLRPGELALDETPGVDPIIHAIREVPGYDYVVVLQPTSPLRTSWDIDRCIELCNRSKGKSCVSVSEPDKSPYWMYIVNETGGMQPLIDQANLALRRQDLLQTYALNGAVYVVQCSKLLESRALVHKDTLAYVMPKERSLDIDDEYDLMLAEYMLQIQLRKGLC